MTDLLKDGTKHLTGVEETVLKNVAAVKQLSRIMRTSLGPNGMHKLLINHHGKLFVTSDSATIARELEVEHPAAKMVVKAAQRQEEEMGDATNLVVVLSGELMAQAESLIRMGLHPSLVVQGYSTALKEALRLIYDSNAIRAETILPTDEERVSRALKAVISAKQYGYADVVAPLVAKACISVAQTKENKEEKSISFYFNQDNVRVAKVLGAGVSDSRIVGGFLIPRNAEGAVTAVSGPAKVAVFQGSVDLARPETKGTVLVKDAQQLVEYSATEEKAMEAAIRALYDAGARVVVAGNAISELALHYIDRLGMMAVRIPSKFDLRRLCECVGASPMLTLPSGSSAVNARKFGSCDSVKVTEIGSTRCTVFENAASRVATIVVRASTQNTLDDIERAIDDGVCVYRQMCRDGRFVAGAGATETELALRLHEYASTQPGLDQYAVNKFAEAFEVVPRTLAENAGLMHNQIVNDLYAAHKEGKACAGVDIVNEGIVDDAFAAGIWDHLAVKAQAIEYAANAVITILRVDQIIMQKPAGGPKVMNRGGAMDADEPDFV